MKSQKNLPKAIAGITHRHCSTIRACLIRATRSPTGDKGVTVRRVPQRCVERMDIAAIVRRAPRSVPNVTR